MRLRIGPFDPALHVRSRDHYEAVRREAQLLALGNDSPPRRLDELVDRLNAEFPDGGIDPVVDKAYLAGEATVTAEQTVPDELVGAALAACDELERLLDELDAWARDRGANLLEAPPDVRAHRVALLGQVREQLRAALPAAR
jgi:hypothetical protein